VRSIAGVPTSITAFIGRTRSGPVNKPVTIYGYFDFLRIFGHLWSESSLGFAVQDFFRNGGNQAIVVRLYHPDPLKSSKTRLAVGEIKLEAANEGSWGMKLRATIDQNVTEEEAKTLGLTKADVFNLTVKKVNDQRTERFSNLSVKDSPRRVDKVLSAESKLVRWAEDWPSQLPAITSGDDKLTEAEKKLDAAKKTVPINPVKVNAAAKAVEAAKNAMEASDGFALTLKDDFCPAGAECDMKGLYALEQADIFNILCIPPYLASGDVDRDLVAKAAEYCEKRRAFLIVDPPSDWKDKESAKTGMSTGVGTRSKNAALFFPRLQQLNPEQPNQIKVVAPCGAVAGVFARMDANFGVWKAPAGLNANLKAVTDLNVRLSDAENDELNSLGINCLRIISNVGFVVWGARTLQGDDVLASEWKYIPVRRLALFLEESVCRGIQWAIFTPNNELLWRLIRRHIRAFMLTLFKQGAFVGKTPKEAYFVKCDGETTTQDDIDKGIVNIILGFAPLKPSEFIFIIIKIRQMARQTDE
jgi:phage tail sheath protein FI